VTLLLTDQVDQVRRVTGVEQTEVGGQAQRRRVGPPRAPARRRNAPAAIGSVLLRFVQAVNGIL